MPLPSKPYLQPERLCLLSSFLLYGHMGESFAELFTVCVFMQIDNHVETCQANASGSRAFLPFDLNHCYNHRPLGISDEELHPTVLEAEQ